MNQDKFFKRVNQANAFFDKYDFVFNYIDKGLSYMEKVKEVYDLTNEVFHFEKN